MKDHSLKDLLQAQRIYIILGALFIASLGQVVNTFSVLFLLCTFNIIDWALFGPLLLSGFLFKVLVAAGKTPLLCSGSGKDLTYNPQANWILKNIIMP